VFYLDIVRHRGVCGPVCDKKASALVDDGANVVAGGHCKTKGGGGVDRSMPPVGNSLAKGRDKKKRAGWTLG
jgi:hypothetical protein